MLVVGVAFYAVNAQQKNAKKENITRFDEDLKSGKIESLFCPAGTYRYNVILKDGQYSGKDASKMYDYYFYGSSGIHEKVRNAVMEYNAKADADPTLSKIKLEEANPITTNYMNIIFYGLIIAAMVIVGIMVLRGIRTQNMQALNIGKSAARVSQNVKTRFSDVAGAEEEKEELVEVIDFLKNPKKYTEMGAKIPTGILLVGPPGTGKTLFAKAVAGEAGVPFFSISGSDFVEMYVGVGASRVRSLFDQAKRNMPCIVFIDEIDAVGRHRGAGLGGGNDEREQTLNQLLVELDGFEVNGRIICMAATNRSDILDPALMRPGRFDRQIYVNRPDVRGREAILKVHARNKPLASDVDFKVVARITAGSTGADLANLLNEAAIYAVRQKHNKIFMNDINEALEKLAMGPAKKSRVVTERDKRITAYHESGHAILGYVQPDYDDTIHEVTIIPRGRAGGYTLSRPDGDQTYVCRSKYVADIVMTLGGRIAEQLVLEDYTTGASGDIKQATKMARDMVAEYGMTDALGMVYLGGEQEVFIGRDYGSTKVISDMTASKIDNEIKRIIDECHKKGEELLKQNMDKLHVMAKVLIAKETIFEEEVEMIMNGASAEEVCESVDKKWAKKEEENQKRLAVRLEEVKNPNDNDDGNDKTDGGNAPFDGASNDGGNKPTDKKEKGDSEINIFDRTVSR